MILVDANLLLYAKFSDFPQHERARDWLLERLSAPTKVGIPWESSLAFLRVSTNSRLFDRPLSITAAWKQITEWLDHPRVWVPQATAEHSLVVGKLLVQTQATGKLVPDAHLAAIAIEHGLTLCSADSDFARFPDVAWINPLIAESA